MEKVIYFDNDDQKVDYCSGKVYYNFIEYAFAEADFFMLVYVNYYGHGYTKTMKSFMKELQPFQVKRRTNPSWPGTLWTVCRNTSYKVVFYKNNDAAKEILEKVSCLSDWSRPSYPQDLAFFKGNLCWSYSVGHEKIGAIIRATEKDLDFVERNGLALRSSASEFDSEYFTQYDEQII